MYKRILVAVDGSHTSNLALDEAIRIARESQGVLRLVHVFNPVVFNPDGEFYAYPELLDAMRHGAEAVVNGAVAQSQQAGVACEGKVLEIDVSGHRIPEMISEEARTWLADIIVIGTHGRQGIHRLLMGSVAEGVVRTATTPVLLIRGE
ncbi:MAG: universal stress protein [Pseudomonadota bacterium]|nr:universal stress protein [Gammaproteobacteria bacterium]MBU1730852.1 universal stress protein [Gammaproteobacteria bacterium]MBU1893512.1 universal stress protein [Gammaproteobacteria bacterium]